MSKTFIDVGMSLDGYIAGRPGNPLGDGGLGIHEWLSKLQQTDVIPSSAVTHVNYRVVR